MAFLFWRSTAYCSTNRLRAGGFDSDARQGFEPFLSTLASIAKMYFARRGDIPILMLGGGTKATQARDIAKAVALAATIEE